MSRFPTWKYTLVVLLVSIGFIYALPNIYKEDPSVQISPKRNHEINAALMEDVETVLSMNQIKPKGIDMTADKLLVRLADPDEQLKAKEYIKEQLGDNYTVALNLAPTTPGWLQSLGADPMVLGLDLQGGVYFLMEVDMDAAVSHHLERLREDARTMLREEKVGYITVKIVNNSLHIVFRNQQELEKGIDKLAIKMNSLDIDTLDGERKPTLRGRIKVAEIATIKKTALAQNITTIRNRINELGVAEPIVQQQGDSRIVIQLPGVQDTTKAKDILSATATLEYRAVDEQNNPLTAQRTGRTPAGSRLYTRRDNGQPILLKKRLIVSGDQLIDAQSGFDSQSGSPSVTVTLNGVGASRMREFTLDNVGKGMAVVFIERKSEMKMVNGELKRVSNIDEKVINVATIREPFGKRFQTTGLDSAKEASSLSLLLRAGALAAPVDIVEERTVGPSLGKDNINQGIESVMYGFIAVLVVMGIYYRLFGMVANLALVMNLILMSAILSMIGATLTLPGIAGIVLTVGMAVDANVLIFERIREELRAGNTPRASIDAGYDKAFSTIADANITTFIAAIVLYGFGSGPVKGFAVTLMIGIVTSMFTAIMGSRAVISLIYGSGKGRIKSLSI
ncbi:MAG: protein translocase subunit SecD [bacterium]